MKWRERTPPDFRWAVKASRFLTHIKRLREPEEPVGRLMERAAGLGDKLDTILLQLPPTLKADADLLRECLAQFPAGTRVAVEPRHESWWTDEIRALLERYGAALCWADRDEKPIAPLWRTTDWGYLRLPPRVRELAVPAGDARSCGPTGWPPPGAGRGRARLLQQRPRLRRGRRRRGLRRRRPPGGRDADPRADGGPGDRPGLDPDQQPPWSVSRPAGPRRAATPSWSAASPQDVLHGEGVGQRHDRALGAPGAQALGHLDQLVRVAAAQRRAGDRLGLGAGAVQHDRLSGGGSGAGRRSSPPSRRPAPARAARSAATSSASPTGRRRSRAAARPRRRRRRGTASRWRPRAPASRAASGRRRRRRRRGRAARRRPAPGRTAGRPGRSRAATPRSACTERTSPIAPSATSSRSATTAGWNRVHIASMTKTPVSRARSTTSAAPAAVAVNAFSTSSALPARRAARAMAWCCGCGVAT